MYFKQIINYFLILLLSYNGSVESFGFRYTKDGVPTFEHESSVISLPPVSSVSISIEPAQPAVQPIGGDLTNSSAGLPKSTQTELVKFPEIFSQLLTPKKMLAAAGISAGLGIAYKTNSTVKDTVDSVRSTTVDKVKTTKHRILDWFSKPLTQFDVYATGAIAGMGYLAYKTDIASKLYKKSADFTNSCKASGTKAYNALSSAISSVSHGQAIAGSAVFMAGTGFLWYLYKRYSKPSAYIEAYRKFEASLRPNLQKLSEQYPKFIELYGQAEENPHCLLEKQEFEQAPLVKLLKPQQKRLLLEAIKIFDQCKK